MNLTAYKKAQHELEALPSISEYMEGERHPSFYLERVKKLLHTLGNPERGFHIIHVGGTAGKGSVTLYLHHMLRATGKQVGSFISPHVTTAVERTIINTRPISTEDFVWAWKKVKNAIHEVSEEYGSTYTPSYFEAHFAMSLLLFHKHDIAWVTLEVGCGGEYDATNAIPNPEVSVITNVYLDHMQLLGRTRAAITKTKAGIIKSKSIIFTGETDKKIQKIITQRAKKKHIPFFVVKQPTYHIQYSADTMRWKHKRLGTISSHLLGAHQVHNTEIAIRVALYLKLPISAITAGIRDTRIPARSEIMQHNPTVLIDGAHNPAKVRALTTLLPKLNAGTMHAIIGIGENKQIQQMLKILVPYFTNICFTSASLEVPKPAKPRALISVAKKLFPNRTFFSRHNPQSALNLILKKAKGQDLVVVTGSLYLSGEIRSHWIPELHILKTHNLFMA